jgi:hypothetical protein
MSPAQRRGPTCIRFDRVAERWPAMAELTGPASYFPSIEKKYGRPIEEWKDIVRSAATADPAAKHMQLVGVLKTEHGMGHGHANAVVAHTLAEARTA